MWMNVVHTNDWAKRLTLQAAVRANWEEEIEKKRVERAVRRRQVIVRRQGSLKRGPPELTGIAPLRSLPTVYVAVPRVMRSPRFDDPDNRGRRRGEMTDKSVRQK